MFTYTAVGIIATLLTLNAGVPALAAMGTNPSPFQQLASNFNPGWLSKYKAPVDEFVRQAMLLAQSPENNVVGAAGSQSRPPPPPALTNSSQHSFTLDTSGMPQNEQAVGVSSSNVVVASNDYRTIITFENRCFFHSNCTGIFIGTGIDTSSDGGVTVTHDQLGPVNPNAKGIVNGDPGVAVSGTTFYVSSLNFSIITGAAGIVLWKSTDGGNTWTATKDPVRATTSFFPDKPAIAAFGRNIYITWTNFSFSGVTIEATVSNDAGKSWETHAISPLNSANFGFGFYQFAYPAVDASGKVYAVYANYTDAVANLFACGGFGSGKCNPAYGPIEIDYVTSTTKGASWSTPVAIQTITAPLIWPFGYFCIFGSCFGPQLAGHDFRTATQPKIAVGMTPASTTNPTVLVAWEDVSVGQQVQLGSCASTSSSSSGIVFPCTPGEKGAAIFAIHSTDGGTTWSSPTQVSPAFSNANGSASFFDSYMPWVSVDASNGHVVLAYYTSQNDPYNNLIQIQVASSSDGGNTFVRNTLPQVYAPNVEFFFNGFFWGDYLGIIAAGGKVAVAYTGDSVPFSGYFQEDPFLTVVSD